jgi:hypothetical protein
MSLDWRPLAESGYDDAVVGGFLFLDPLHHDAVVQWSYSHDAVSLYLL